MSHLIYEQPLNERMRSMMRLEHLFNQTSQALNAESTWHRQVISSMIEILSLLERADLKTEFFKEIDRLSVVLNKLKQQKNVNQNTLDKLLVTLKEQSTLLHQTNGRLGDKLRGNELLNIVRPRLSIPGGTCSFDVPALHHWLSQPANVRRRELQEWYALFEPIETTVKLILDVIRQSAYDEDAHAPQGYFQKALETQAPCQLIRVTLKEPAVFPEISGGKHRISIRFLRHSDDLHPVPSQDDVYFSLGCCII